LRINLNNKLISAVLFLPLFFQGGFLIDAPDKNEKVIREEVNRQSEEIKEIKVKKPDKLDIWIDDLEKYELDKSFSRDYCKIDVDGVEVCGCLQYKFTTFIDDNEKYEVFENPTEKYKDCRSQKRLAKITLQNEPNGWRRWMTSVKRGLGYPPEL
jgi:hypothetical protein